MHLDYNIFYWTVPALLLLIGIESVFLIKEHRPDNKDILSSIGLVLGRLPVSAITKGVVIYFYSLIYEYRLFTIPIIYWWAWVICFFLMIFLFTGFTALAIK